MNSVMSPLRAATATTLAVTAATATAACSGPRQPGPTSYCLAPGRLAVPGSPARRGRCRRRNPARLPDIVYARPCPGHPVLMLVQPGCPGETTLTAIRHGIGPAPQAAASLATILSGLRAAAGAGARTAGMNYYLPELAERRRGEFGHAIARASVRLAAGYNGSLEGTCTRAGVAVAGVSGAFDTVGFGDPAATPGIGTLPRDVALICRRTWECAHPPRGPNQHASPAGHRVIANAVPRAASLGVTSGR